MDNEIRRLERLVATDPSPQNLVLLGLAQLRSGKQLELTIIGRRWFNRNKGSTYHTAEVFINGHRIGKSGMAYGYGEQYTVTGYAIAVEAGLPRRERNTEPVWTWAEKNNIKFEYYAIDVKRKKDL